MTTQAIGLPRPSQATLAALLVLATVIAGCATAASPSASVEPSLSVSPSERPSESAAAPTSTPAPSPTPEPTPEPITATSATFSLLGVEPPADFSSTISCDGDIGASDPVAIVRMKPSDPAIPAPQVLRTYADITTPRTACTFGDVRVEDLIDARHVLISNGADHAVVDLPEVRYHWFRLPVVDGGNATLLAASPDLDAVVWAKWVAEPESRQLMITTAAGDEVVANLPGNLDGRCGSAEDSNRADYPHVGHHYYVLDQLILNLNALVVAEGSTAKLEIMPSEEANSRDPATIPTFAVWSPVAEVLYYRQGNDVMRWTPDGGSELFLPNTRWYYPSITGDGRYLAYVAESDLYLADLAATEVNPNVIRSDVARAAFVNDAQLWFEANSMSGCITGERQVWIYDVRDGSEAPSAISWVDEVWPGTSSNH